MAAVLYVEGKDDLYVISNLCEHHRVLENFVVKDVEGKDKLVQAFRASLRVRNSQVLGIVIDADDDLSACWDRLKNILVESGYRSVPSSPSELGLVIVETELPKVGIWIMPDNKLPGMLEDFVRFLLPADDRLWNRAELVVDELLEPPQKVRFSSVHRSKAIVHTWLAWQEEPGKPLGQAITARYLNADANYAQRFVAWLQRLFG